MILTLTPNPAVDVTVTTEQLDRGATRVVDAARRRAGGKGVNVSRVLAQQGEDTHAVLPVGSGEESWFDDDLASVPHTLVPCAGPTRHSYALVETGEDVTSMLNEHGAQRTAAEWDAVLAAVRGLSTSADVLVASGSLPPGAPSDVLQTIVGIGREAGVPVVVDVSGTHLLAAADAGADILKPNRDELAAALGDLDVLDAARELQRRGAGIVVVSLGPDGLLVVPPSGQAVHARLPAALRGNPTGAGDAAVAAIASLLRRRDVSTLGPDDLEAVARRAVAWSAAAVLSPWAGSLAVDPATLEPEVEISTTQPGSASPARATS
jgi:1-phosphofructokinase family hexose kinase